MPYGDEGNDAALEQDNGGGTGDMQALDLREQVMVIVAKEQAFCYTNVELQRRSFFRWSIPPCPGGKYAAGQLTISGRVKARPNDGSGDVEFVVVLKEGLGHGSWEKSQVIDGSGDVEVDFSFSFDALWNSPYNVSLQTRQKDSHRLEGTVSGIMASP